MERRTELVARCGGRSEQRQIDVGRQAGEAVRQIDGVAVLPPAERLVVDLREVDRDLHPNSLLYRTARYALAIRSPGLRGPKARSRSASSSAGEPPRSRKALAGL